MGEAVLDKADCADADSSARRPQQDHQHLDCRPRPPRPGPAARTSHQLRRCNLSIRSAADGVRDLPDGGGGGRRWSRHERTGGRAAAGRQGCVG